MIGLEKLISQIVENSISSHWIMKINKSPEAENPSFSLDVIKKDEVINAIKNVHIHKCTICGEIQAKILKQHAQINSKKLTDIFNESRKISKFP